MNKAELPEVMTLTEIRYKAPVLVKTLERGQNVIIMKRGKQIGVLYPIQNIIKVPMKERIKLPKIQGGAQVKLEDLRREKIYGKPS